MVPTVRIEAGGAVKRVKVDYDRGDEALAVRLAQQALPIAAQLGRLVRDVHGSHAAA